MDYKLNNYVRNLLMDCEVNRFILEFPIAVIRNCDDEGEMITFDTSAKYKKQNKPYWLLMKPLSFEENGEKFLVYQCSSCEAMRGVDTLKISQKKDDMRTNQCIHSQAIHKIIPTPENVWNEEDILNNRDLENSIEKKYVTLKDHKKFLAVVTGVKNRISLLFTVGSKQKIPYCSNCSSTKCICFKTLERLVNEERENEDDLSSDNETIQYKLFWERKENDTEETISDFRSKLNYNEHILHYGHNFCGFKYPIETDELISQNYLNSVKGSMTNIPNEFIPLETHDQECKHNNLFNFDDDRLILLGENITIFADSNEKRVKCFNYGRPSLGNCKCILQYDTHENLLWNIGGNKFLDYVFLYSALHRVMEGTPINSVYNARRLSLSTSGFTSELSYSDFLRSLTGFIQNISVSPQSFICPSCGDTPKYLVGDGKTLGITKRKVNGLTELKHHPDDLQILSQGSSFKERTFIEKRQERGSICNFLQNPNDIENLEEDLRSENGQLVLNLVRRLHTQWPDEVPKPYKTFIANISKETSAAGYLNVTSKESLTLLSRFCRGNIDLLSHDNMSLLQKVQRELPAVWKNITDLVNLENRHDLPQDVSVILLKILKIRKDTFLKAATRSSSDYTRWDHSTIEHPTQFYPWPLIRYPSRYEIDERTDNDFCDKKYGRTKDFTSGIFSVGCPCPNNITYGFEIMIKPESAKNFFRLLMCRNLSMRKLKGVIFDNACGLDRYILNREPREFQYLRCLVDGSHWNGQKKLRYSDNNGRRGHLGCSDSFNFNLYKEHLREGTFSQGREQMHSKLTKLSTSLQQMNYRNHMTFLRLFFSIQNIQNKKS